MMKVQTTIQKWGNSLAIRITGPLKTIPHFSENMPVEVEVSEEGLMIHPIAKKKKALLVREAQLLEGLTAKKIHANEIDIDGMTFKQLQMRAARHGVSMEEELKQIIYQAVSTPESVTSVFRKYFGEKNGVDLVLTRRKPHEPMDFDE